MFEVWYQLPTFLAHRMRQTVVCLVGAHAGEKIRLVNDIIWIAVEKPVLDFDRLRQINVGFHLLDLLHKLQHLQVHLGQHGGRFAINTLMCVCACRNKYIKL